MINIIDAKSQFYKESLNPSFDDYIEAVIENAKAMAEVFLERGYNVITKGTDSHILLLDLSDKSISGREAADLLEVNDITVNKNGVPNDPRNFIETSGIRMGTAAETTRGSGVEDFRIMAEHMINIMEGQ